MFPLAGVSSRIHSGMWNIRVVDAATHEALHIGLYRNEQLLRLIVNPFTTAGRVLFDLANDDCP